MYVTDRDGVGYDRLHLSRRRRGLVVVVPVEGRGESTGSSERGRAEGVGRVGGLSLGRDDTEPRRDGESGVDREPHVESQEQIAQRLARVCERIKEKCLE